MAQNLLDHSVPLDINLTISDELAEQVYETTAIGGYKKSRLPQLQMLEKLEALSRLVAYAPNTECIILRNEDKQEIPYDDTDLKQRVIELVDYGYRDHFVDASAVRNKLTAYNNLLHQTLIDHPTFPAEGVKMRKGKVFKINPSDKFVRRIYNRSSFEWNGRFSIPYNPCYI